MPKYSKGIGFCPLLMSDEERLRMTVGLQVAEFTKNKMHALVP